MKKYIVLGFALLMLSARLPAQNDATATLSAAGATCAVTNACLVLPLANNSGGATITVSANASGNTIQFEGTADSGTTWVAITSVQNSASASSQASSTTGTGTWQFSVSSYSSVRARMSTLVSGTTTVTIRNSIAAARAAGGGAGSFPFQTANTVFAGPISGASAAPAFRALTVSDMPASVPPGMQNITVARNCPAAALNVTCFVVADDGHIVSDATWSAGATVQVTIGGTDPAFQCPGASYPCNSSTPGCNASQTNLPNTSCDVFKVAFGTANCRSTNPSQCDNSIPAGTIASIQSATQATLTSTAATASSTGSASTQFAWFTLDDTPLAAAADHAFTSNVPTQVSLPCGYMGYSTSNFNPVRVTRVVAINVAFNGYHCATFIVPPNFTCTGASGNGCLIFAGNTTGQNSVAVQMWTDATEGITFLGLGAATPTNIASQFPATTSSLAYANTYSVSRDIWVVGLFWNASKTIYGQSCAGCELLDNNVAWSAGSRGLYVSPSVQGTATIKSGFYGNSSSHSCDVDGGSNVVLLSGTQCNFPLNNCTTEAGAGLDTLSTFTGTLYSVGSNIEGCPYFNSGYIHLFDYYSNPNGGSSGIFVQNAAVNLFLHAWHNPVNGGKWLTLSAGTVHFDCGNSSSAANGFSGTNAAVITGGSLQVDPCSVGSDNQLAQVAAINAKTLFTVGTGTALFRVHISAECTTSSAAATVTPAVLYTDTSNTAQTVTGTAATCTTLGAASNTSQDVTFRAKNATAIQYKIMIANTPTYDVSVIVEQLSLN